MSTVTMSAEQSTTLRVCVLGPLALAVEGQDVAVPGAKRRATLALLALADGAVVTAADLVDALWPDDPPERGRGALHSHVSRLRGHLGAAADRLVATEHGYRLVLRRGELDVHAARDALAIADNVADEDPTAAAERLAAVRELWRGQPLAEFDDVLPIAARGIALRDLRRQVDALLVRCALRAGQLDRAVAAATAAATDDPLSEASVRLRMEALAAAGRRAEALGAAAELRRRLRTALGAEPTAELADLERTIASGFATPLDARSDATAAAATGALPIPHPVTALVGRESEVGAVGRLLDTERLVTIVGAGGVGKTRLAADIARRQEADVHWVALAPLTDPDDLPRSLATALGLEAARGEVLDACIHLLAAGDRLLVLDNCEHVVERARDVVSRLLHGCPTLKLLATSRQRLGLTVECTFRLGPLALPELCSPHPELAPSLALFLDRARRVRPGFEPDPDARAAAVTIVRRLEGVPLAIELAAGRLSSLSVGDIRDRLDRALDMLQGGRSSSDPRHQALRATLAWSYDLLPADRQRLLGHLAVFPDGADLATAEQVADDVGVVDDPAVALGHLVDASMLDADLDGPTRYRMLDTVRAFALEQLDATGERDAAELRVLQWAETFTAWVDTTLHTPDEPLADARLRRELSNLRAAWALALQRGAVDTAIAIIVALDDAAQWRDLPEVWSWAHALLDDPRLADHPRRAAALATASDFAWLQGDLARARELAESALACATDDDGRARALIASSVARLSHGEFPAATEHALEAAAISPSPAHARLIAALATAYSGDLETAVAINGEIDGPAGVTQEAEWEYAAGELASIGGRLTEAEQHYHRAIELASRVGSSFVVGIATVGRLTVLGRTGRHADALRGYREVLDYWQHAGNWLQVWTTLRNVADLLVRLGDGETGGILLTAADRAPDAPAVGESAWQHPGDGIQPGAEAPPTVLTGAGATALAVSAIERLLEREQPLG